MRFSKQKNLIKSIIDTNYSHPNAYEIYTLCQKDIPNISLGTVYRNLSALVEEGSIIQIKMPNNIDRYDHIGQNHSHFLCYKCNLAYDIDFKLNEKTVKIKNHKVMNYEINFKGICEKCQSKKED